ncbi:hypothetical protein GCM10009738_42610 [Kitasatospora viridis]
MVRKWVAIWAVLLPASRAMSELLWAAQTMHTRATVRRAPSLDALPVAGGAVVSVVTWGSSDADAMGRAVLGRR